MTEEIKPKRVWITRDYGAGPYLVWDHKPTQQTTNWGTVWRYRYGTFIWAIGATTAKRLLGKIPKHVIKGGEKAISRGYLYCAADWEEE